MLKKLILVATMATMANFAYGMHGGEDDKSFVRKQLMKMCKAGRAAAAQRRNPLLYVDAVGECVAKKVDFLLLLARIELGDYIAERQLGLIADEMHRRELEKRVKQHRNRQQSARKS